MSGKHSEEDPDPSNPSSAEKPTETIAVPVSNDADRPAPPTSNPEFSGPFPASRLSERPISGDTAEAARHGRSGSVLDEPRTPRGTLDLGLLILRLVVGVTMLVHGLQKLVGWWSGPGIDGFEDILVSAGFDQARLLAYLSAGGEVAVGVLLIIGLVTPWAAAAAVAILINAWAYIQAAEPGLAYFAADGVEFETVLAASAAAIVLTGPGRISLDSGRGWATRPRVGSVVVLLIGIAAGVCIWIFLNGTNPFAR